MDGGVGGTGNGRRSDNGGPQPGEQVLAVICLIIGFISLGSNASTLLVTTGSSLEFTRLGCWVFRFLRVFGHLLSLLALERYIFFLHPLRYCVLCSKRNMMAAGALLNGIASVITSMGYFIHTLAFNPTFGFCRLGNNFLNTIIMTATYALPNIVIQLFVILRVGLMPRRTRCEVAAASPYPSSPLATLALNLSSALRVILLTSGLFWVTYLPSTTLAWALRRHGYSPDLMKSLPYHYITYIYRVSNIVLFSLPLAISPFVHLYVNKELRMFTMKDMRAMRERLRVCMRHVYTRSLCRYRVAPEEVHTA